jgi:hypothetical protein
MRPSRMTDRPGRIDWAGDGTANSNRVLKAAGITGMNSPKACWHGLPRFAARRNDRTPAMSSPCTGTARASRRAISPFDSRR